MLASDVLSTLPSPTCVAVTPETVPVKVGFAVGALASSCVWIAEVTLFKYPSSVELTSPIEVVPGRVTVPVKVGPESGAYVEEAVEVASFPSICV